MLTSQLHFLASPLKEGNMGFKHCDDLVLKMHLSVCGIHQAPHNIFHYSVEHLQKQRLWPSDLDPCLIVGTTVIVIMYVDDILLYANEGHKMTSLWLVYMMLEFRTT